MELQQDNALILTQGERLALYTALSVQQAQALASCSKALVELKLASSKGEKDAQLAADTANEMLREINTIMYDLDPAWEEDTKLDKGSIVILLHVMRRFETSSFLDEVREGYRVYLDILHELAKKQLES